MKALPRRKGNRRSFHHELLFRGASMKAHPKRKGNSRLRVQPVASPMSLNESLHLKVQNKRSRGYPGDIDLSYWKSPQADGNNLFRFRGKRLGETLMKVPAKL